MTPGDFFKRIEAHHHEFESAGVRRLGVYGSVARGEADQDSDVDVLVESTGPPTSSSLPRSGNVLLKYSGGQRISPRHKA